MKNCKNKFHKGSYKNILMHFNTERQTNVLETNFLGVLEIVQTKRLYEKIWISARGKNIEIYTALLLH